MPAATRSCPACSTPLPEEAQFCLHCGAATPTDPGAPPRTAPTGITEINKVQRALADRYRIDRVLGEGGMATVYQAEDLKHHRQVAVKVMRPELAATLGADRFLREIEIAAKLSHPHILPVHDSGEASGFLYYVMPNVEGESVRDRIHRDGRLPVEEAVRLAREVAEALAYAHKRGIIHRDIKPANIMLGEGHALVADFGIARALRAEVALTGTGLAVGTPQYMSPEQASGAKDVDARADIYAVGGVLYEMLAGEPPYTGETPQAILAKSLTEEVRPLGTVRPDVPPAVAAVVARAMVRSPAGRYATAAELAEALGGALDAVRSGTFAAHPPGPSPLQVWGVFGGAAAVTLAVVYGLVRRWGLPAWTLGLAAVLLLIGAGVLIATGRFEARRRAGAKTPGLARWFTWRYATYGGGLAGVLWVGVALLLIFRGPTGGGTAGTTRLAVLPFENRGAPDDAYFVEGVADQVRGKLAGLSGFQVTARTSSDQYRGSPKPPQEIGRELGVDYLLTATVTWARQGDAGRVQVVPELITVRTGAVTWQQTFSASLTDVFQVQADIATQVAGALGVALGAAEQRVLGARPTTNLAAYDAYLRAEELSERGLGGSPIALRQSIPYYEQAVALDSNFVLAWARLARSRARLYFLTVPMPEDAEGSRLAAERTREIAPDGPEGYLALGDYYSYVAKDDGRAREFYLQGLRLAPTHTDLLTAAARVERVLGDAETAMRQLREAERLDPRSPTTLNSLADLLLVLRRYAEADDVAQRAVAVAPGSFRARLTAVVIHLAQGDLPAARSAAREVPQGADSGAWAAYMGTYFDLFWGLEDSQQDLLLRLPPSAFDDDRATWAAVRMQVYGMRNQTAMTRAFADSARMAYELQIQAAPQDASLHTLYGVALAYLGRREQAIRQGEHGVNLARNTTAATYLQHQLARIYVRVGEPERALDLIEALLKLPYHVSPGWLRIDPDFAPLKGNPRFERLIAGH